MQLKTLFLSILCLLGFVQMALFGISDSFMGMYGNGLKLDDVSAYVQGQKDKILKASDLREEQKQLLFRLYDQLDIKAIISERSYDSFSTLQSNQEEQIKAMGIYKLIKYFPVALVTLPDPFSRHGVKPLIDKQKLSLTEQVLINVALQVFERKGVRFDVPVDSYDEVLTEKLSFLEKEFKTQGYQTFVHGRSWYFNFTNDMWRIVCALKSNATQLSDNVSLRYRMGQQDVATLRSYRTDLVMHGPEGGAMQIRSGNGKNSEITCMNRTLYSNSDSPVIHTARYVAAKTFVPENCDNVTDPVIEQMFQDSNLHTLYEQFKDQISLLIKLHLQANQQGELLCVAVRQDCVDEMVYVAGGGGRKISGLASNKIDDDGKSVALFSSADDTGTGQFYCLAVSDMPGDDGKCLIKSVHNADEAKYATYVQKRDALFAQMRSEMQKEKQL